MRVGEPSAGLWGTQARAVVRELGLIVIDDRHPLVSEADQADLLARHRDVS